MQKYMKAVVICDIPPKRTLNSYLANSRFSKTILLSYQIALKFCTNHDIALLWANFGNNFIPEMDVLHERLFASFESKIRFWQVV